jgi:hypothetical protein
MMLADFVFEAVLPLLDLFHPHAHPVELLDWIAHRARDRQARHNRQCDEPYPLHLRHGQTGDIGRQGPPGSAFVPGAPRQDRDVEGATQEVSYPTRASCRATDVPRDGAIIFRDIVGKLA